MSLVEQDSSHEGADAMGPTSSCSSPDENSYCGDEWSYSLELTDVYALDEEVGKRLNQMVPIPVSGFKKCVFFLMNQIDKLFVPMKKLLMTYPDFHYAILDIWIFLCVVHPVPCESFFIFGERYPFCICCILT